MKAAYRLVAIGVVLMATSLLAVDHSANAPMNDGVDRSDSKFVTHLFVKR